MAYDSTTKLITAPVSFYDVQRCLATSEQTLKGLCTHANINKWSKKKPVINDILFTGVVIDWWKAKNGNCGLVVPNFSTLTSMISAIRSGGTLWDYQTPAGGASSPYRLADFNGYDHLASPPFGIMALDNTYYMDSASTINAALNLYTSETALTLSDIGFTFPLKDFFFAIAIVPYGSNDGQWLSSSTPISGGNSTLNIALNYLTVGSYDVIHFLVEIAKPLITSSSSINTYIPLPQVIQTITISNSAIFVVVHGSFTCAKLYWNISIANNSSSNKTYTGCYVTARYGNSAVDDALVNGEIQVSLGTIEIAANSTYTNSGVMLSALPDRDSMGGGYMLFQSYRSPNTIGEI